MTPHDFWMAMGFSLPTQRCFYGDERAENAADLFSAYAEVFLVDY